MLKFAANLTFLYNTMPLLDRIAAAAKAGFKAIECAVPYEEPADRLRATLDKHGMVQALINSRPGSSPAERGFLAVQGKDSEFADTVALAIDYAASLSCPRVNMQAGIAPQNEPPASIKDRLVERLRYAADEFARHGINALLEHCNPHDMPGYFITTPSMAVDALARVDRPNAKLQYDIYHAQRTSGELVQFLRDNFSLIDHIQVADNPGRHQPGTGEINYQFVLAELDRLGYQGWIGLEYKALPEPDKSYGWIQELGYSL